MEQFEDKLHQDLHQFLLPMKETDERMPQIVPIHLIIVSNWNNRPNTCWLAKSAYSHVDEEVRLGLK